MEHNQPDYVSYAKNQITELREELKKWELFLALVTKNGHSKVESNQQLSFLPDPPVQKTKKNKKSPKLTIRDKVTEILKEADMFLTSRELMEIINNKYPDKQYKSLIQFSGAFATMHLRENSGIRKYELENPTLELKALYGLDEFYTEDNEVKTTYKERIKHRYGRV